MIDKLKKTKLDYDILDLPDTIVGQAEYLKEYFDKNTYQLIKESINPLIDSLLLAENTNSGADNIGSGEIVGVNGSTVQAKLTDLKSQITQAMLGEIPDSTITTKKLANDSITEDKIAINAITSEKMQLESIKANKFAKNIARSFSGVVEKIDNLFNIIVDNEGVENYELTFKAPTNFDKLDTYTINGIPVTLLNNKNRPIVRAWVCDVIVSLNVSGDKAFLKGGGGGDEILVDVADTVDLHLGDKVAFSEFDGKWYNSIFNCYRKNTINYNYIFTLNGVNYRWAYSSISTNEYSISLYNADTNEKICNDLIITAPPPIPNSTYRYIFDRLTVLTLNGFDTDILLGYKTTITSQYHGDMIYRIKYNETTNDLFAKSYSVEHSYIETNSTSNARRTVNCIRYKKDHSYMFYSYHSYNPGQFYKRFVKIDYIDDVFVKKFDINVYNSARSESINLESIATYDDIVYIQGAVFNGNGTVIYGNVSTNFVTTPRVAITSNCKIVGDTADTSSLNKLLITKYNGSEAVKYNLKSDLYKHVHFCGDYCFDGEILLKQEVLFNITGNTNHIRMGALTNVSYKEIDDTYIEQLQPLPNGDKFRDGRIYVHEPYCSQDEEYKYYRGVLYMFKKHKYKRWIVSSINEDDTITIKEILNESVN